MNASLKDAIYGLAVGDALGVPFEFNERGTFKAIGMVGNGTFNLPAGTWSDDTSMTLATCKSIQQKGIIDTQDMQTRFCKWVNEGAYTVEGTFGVGRTTQRALSQGYGCDGERDNGNGSLMRIVPLAFTDASAEQIRAVSAITHAHETSMNACVVFVEYARALIEGAAPAQALHVIDETNKDEKLARLSTIHEHKRESIKSSGYVVNTIEAALWCLLTTASYKECVLKAVNLGEDTDTTAAVAGGLAGIVYGIEGIPQEWMQALRGTEQIEDCLF